jgi:hypothetical protein
MQLEKFLYLDFLCFYKQKNVRHSGGCVLRVHVVERVAAIGIDEDLAADGVLVVRRVVVIIAEVVRQREHGEAVAKHDPRIVRVGDGLAPRRLGCVGEQC